ncbi:hypothetical protein RUM44_013548 [Polyplax serrata]|uniref:deoxyribose-phosphate aldolase n=1 Tax=Polyplax serrata TaxID=468196 RepID=A0ABR1BGP1_POLSC
MINNPGCSLDLGWLNNVAVNAISVYDIEKEILLDKKKLDAPNNEKTKIDYLFNAVKFLDLTTLSGNDTGSNVTRLTRKAVNPISNEILKVLKYNEENPHLKTAAVCVYPDRVGDVADVLNKSKHKVAIAAVSPDFPSGQCKTCSKEVMYSINKGATEIDIVIKRNLVLTGNWEQLYNDIQNVKEQICSRAILKTILSVGELGNFRNIYKASLVAMMAGSDFIKTSTGKETLNATLPVGLVMMRAIQDYYQETGWMVGFKAAGGIRKTDDALKWQLLAVRELGSNWLNKTYFRIGASGLLQEIEHDLYRLGFRKPPESNIFTLS